MPPFNPALIGAPSPVGRGGASGDLPVGAIGHFLTNPGSKYSQLRGDYLSLSDAQVAALGFEPQVQTMGDPGQGVKAMGTGVNNQGGAYGAGTYVFRSVSGGTTSSSLSVTSDDGASFQLASTSVTQTQRRIIYSAGRFVILNENGFQMSANGKTGWSQLGPPDSPMAPASDGLAEGEDCFVYYFSNAKSLYKWVPATGLWTKMSLPTTVGNFNQFFDLAYVPALKRHYMSWQDAGGSFYTSWTTDLINWISRPGLIQGFTYAFGYIVASSGSNLSFYDPDTLAYIQGAPLGSSGLNTVKMLNGILICLGSGGVAEVTDPTNVRNVSTTNLATLVVGDRGYIAGSSNTNAFVAAPRTPSGIWLPKLAGRRSAKGDMLTPYMRTAA